MSELTWHPVSSGYPEPHRPVLVIVETETGKEFLRACLVPRYDLEHDGDDTAFPPELADCKDDVYYWPEGWYEWNQRGDYFLLEDRVVCWAEVSIAEVTGLGRNRSNDER